MKNLLLLFCAACTALSCSPITKSLVQQPEKPVTEIAIRLVKPGMEADFKEARENFITVLKEQQGVLADREFESFYALPQPNERQVFIGMTDYQTYKTVGKVQGNMGVVSKFLKFKKTMDLKAYVFVQQTEGPKFDLKTLASGSGEILEIGVRKVKPGKEAEFQQYRKQFVELLSSYDGVKESYEFSVVGGKNTDGLSVGMTVYESKDAFMGLVESIMQNEITQAYFSTFDVVASQFSFSTHNQTVAETPPNPINQNEGTSQIMEKKSVMEIAIRKVKAGQDEAFVNARTAFIGLLKSQNGIQKDWEFKSFFTMPEPDDTDVFVGMTRYESAEAMQVIANNLMTSAEAGQFFSTFDMKAFVAMQPADGGEFALEDFIGQGNVLEVAVRSVKAGNEAQFEDKRSGFFDLIAQQEGYLFDKEFIDLQTGDKVVLIGWNSMDDFQIGARFLQTQPEMGEFFSILDVKAYQALILSSNE